MQRKDFGDVLDGLARSERSIRDEAPPSRTRYQRAFIVDADDRARNDRPDTGADRLAGLYVNEPVGEELPGEALQAIQDWVADQLKLTPTMTAQDLNRRRRAFALLYHPDCVAPEAREEASRRMTIANTLIDDALAALAA
jgi:hypothetical protein